MPRDTIVNLALIASPVGGDRAWQQMKPAAYNYTCKNDTGTIFACWREGEDWADIFSNSMMHNIDASKDLGRQMDSFFTTMKNHTGGW